MSRLPTLTPSRTASGSPGGSAIPTPSGLRRPRASLGPAAAPALKADRDPEMDQALKDVLRNRPPSSLSRGVRSDAGDPETPTPSPGAAATNGQPQSPYLSAPDRGAAPRRTPVFRPKTPSSAATPSARPSLAAPRPSLIASTTTPAGRRSASTASSAVSTPLRPESRTGDKWEPVVGERVRLPATGFEGTLRYLGTTHRGEGLWAGVELEGAFKGLGRNNGTVDGHEYFRCAANCGLFTLADKLTAPTSVAATPAGPSRPTSVASQRSLASSYSASGRVTPAADRVRKGATTPSFGTRSTTVRPKNAETPDGGARRTLLGNSTISNATTTPRSATAESKITVGSRASKYVGMTAKQLNERAGTTPTKMPPPNGLSASTTPKAPAKSLAISTSRVARPSLGGSLATTPKAARRVTDMMPPPPSPQLNRTGHANAAATAALEEEIQELKRRNAELEDQVFDAEQAQGERAALETESAARVQELERQVQATQSENDSLQAQLQTSNGDVRETRARVEELETTSSKLQAKLDAKVAEALRLQREMELAAERASGELEAGMEAKRQEVRAIEERVEAAELEAADMKRLVDELTLAGNQIIELNESKQFTFECQIRELEDKLSKAHEELKTATSSAANGTVAAPREATAVEIDNETLTEQVKHLQSRIAKLEEQLDEARSQAETEADAWQAKYDKTGDAKKALADELTAARNEVKAREADVETARARIADLEDAVKENQSALDHAREEIETMRAEASAASASAAKLATTTNASETTITDLRAKLKEAEEHKTQMEARIAELESKGAQLEAQRSELDDKRSALESKSADLEAKGAELQAKVTSLQQEVTNLRAAESVRGSPRVSSEGLTPDGSSPHPPQRSMSFSRRAGSTGSGSMEEAEKSILGYRHIVNEMTAEVAQLRARNTDLLDEIGMLKEENKLLQEINESDGGSGPEAQETAKLWSKVAQQAEALKEYEREVSELETLIESKIYHEDELESRLQELERERDRWRAKAQAVATAASAVGANGISAVSAASTEKAASLNSHSRTDSLVSNGTQESDLRCELCEGPHDLDACPVFAGTTLDGAGSGAEDGPAASPLAGKGVALPKKKWCNDCESSAHDTAECPMADDVF